MFSGDGKGDFDKLLGLHFLLAASSKSLILLNGSAWHSPLESNKAGNDSLPPFLNFHVNPGFIVMMYNVFC